MGVAEGEPQALMAGTAPDHRDHIGKAGTPAQPRRRLHPLPERKQFAGERLVASELYGARRRVAIGEFDARRQANPREHWCQHVSTITVLQRMAERGVAADAV